MDFRYPETKALDWKVNFSGNWETHTVSQDKMRFQTGKKGIMNFQSNLLYFHSNDDNINELAIFSNSQWSERTEPHYIIYPNYSVYNERERNFQGSVYLNWNYYHYLVPEQWNFIGGINSDFNFSESRNNYPAPWETKLYYYKNSGYSIEGVAGIGYGRVRDGSFVYRAVRVIARLKEDGVLLRPLTHEEFVAFVDTLAHMREYTTNFERWNKYFIEDIVSLLKVYGVIEEHYNAGYSMLHLNEIFDENIQSRLFGYRFYITDHAEYKETRNQWVFQVNRYNTPAIGVEGGYPLSLFFSLYGKAELTLDIANFQHFNTLVGELGANYQFDEKLSTNILYSLKADEDIVFHQVSVSLNIFLEDDIKFFVKPVYQYQISNTHSINTNQDADFLINFGLTYNIY